MNWTDAVVLSQLIVTSFLTGVIWFIQIVHYPLFRRIGKEFSLYVSRNRWVTAYLLVPVMLLEMAAALFLVIDPPLAVGRSIPWLGLVLVICIWLSTLGVQLPCHIRLSRARDERTLQRLIQSNWIRTLLWTIRCFIAVGTLVLIMLSAG